MATIVNVTKTLAQMRAFVYFLVNEDSDTFSTSDVNVAINAGLRHVFELTDNEVTKAFRSTEAGTREYDIPEARLTLGQGVVKSVYLDDSALSPTSYVPTLSTDENDIPSAYYINGDNIGLLPTPDDIYTLTVFYLKEMTELTDDSDEVEMSDIAIQTAMYYAAYLLKVKDEELAMANYFKAMADEELTKLVRQNPGVYKYNSMYGSA